jgi:hypothetical protein
MVPNMIYAVAGIYHYEYPMPPYNTEHLVRSLDGGQTWISFEMPSDYRCPACSDLVIDPANPQNIMGHMDAFFINLCNSPNGRIAVGLLIEHSSYGYQNLYFMHLTDWNTYADGDSNNGDWYRGGLIYLGAGCHGTYMNFEISMEGINFMRYKQVALSDYLGYCP